MGPMKAGLGLVAIAVAGAAYLAPAPERPFEALEQKVALAKEQYQVLRAGEPTGCVIGKGDRLADHKAKLELGKGCAEGFGDYADARYWNEEDDGSVALMTADGSVALRFAAGDGHAYEAYGAGVPLFALSDASY